MKISLQKSFYILGSLILLVISMRYAKPVLIPLATALMLSFILFPLVNKFEAYGISRIASAILSIVAMVALILGVFYLFSTQIISLVSQLTDFSERLSMVFEKSVNFLNHNIPVIPEINREEIITQSHVWLKESGIDIMSNTFNDTTSFFSGLLMIVVYTFLLLIYRSGLVSVMISTMGNESKQKIREMIIEMQKVGQHYLFGMAIIIVILGTANSIVLLLFGVDHPFLFGFFAGILAIIPYIGTAIGGLLPVLYAFMTQDTIWVPIGIAISFWIIQAIEGNFLNPKIVGGNLNVNAFAAIISLITGGYLWGIAGMVLFLPLAAIFKVFCSYFDQLKPISLLIGDELYEVKKHRKGKGFNLHLKELLGKL